MIGFMNEDFIYFCDQSGRITTSYDSATWIAAAQDIATCKMLRIRHAICVHHGWLPMKHGNTVQFPTSGNLPALLGLIHLQKEF